MSLVHRGSSGSHFWFSQNLVSSSDIKTVDRLFFWKYYHYNSVLLLSNFWKPNGVAVAILRSASEGRGFDSYSWKVFVTDDHDCFLVWVFFNRYIYYIYIDITQAIAYFGLDCNVYKKRDSQRATERRSPALNYWWTTHWFWHLINVNHHHQYWTYSICLFNFELGPKAMFEPGEQVDIKTFWQVKTGHKPSHSERK